MLRAGKEMHSIHVLGGSEFCNSCGYQAITEPVENPRLPLDGKRGHLCDVIQGVKPYYRKLTPLAPTSSCIDRSEEQKWWQPDKQQELTLLFGQGQRGVGRTHGCTLMNTGIVEQVPCESLIVQRLCRAWGSIDQGLIYLWHPRSIKLGFREFWIGYSLPCAQQPRELHEQIQTLHSEQTRYTNACMHEHHRFKKSHRSACCESRSGFELIAADRNKCDQSLQPSERPG